MKKAFSNQKKFIKQLRKGVPFAYNQLVEIYYKNLCNYAYNLTKDDFKSEDIVQNVIVKLWQHRKKLNPNISLKNYLYKSVYNEFVDQYRKETAVTALEKKYFEGLNSFIETHDEDNKSLMALLEKEIAGLPNKCKETFLLSKKEGLTYTEIAEYQKVSVNTVEKQMVKAFAILRKKIGEKMHTMLFVLFGIKRRTYLRL
nr:RNA polymerase sigma-70 factor [Allomuricauda sp.]